MKVHPYTPLLLGSALFTFTVNQMAGETPALGLGAGLIFSVLSYRALQHWYSTQGNSELRRIILSAALLSLCVLISGPQSTVSLFTGVFITVGALQLSRSLQPASTAQVQVEHDS